MHIVTPIDAAQQAGNKYLAVLVAAKFARYVNELPRAPEAVGGEKLTTVSLKGLVNGDLSYRLVRRRRTEA